MSVRVCSIWTTIANARHVMSRKYWLVRPTPTFHVSRAVLLTIYQDACSDLGEVHKEDSKVMFAKTYNGYLLQNMFRIRNISTVKEEGRCLGRMSCKST